MTAVLSATGLYTPPFSISNDELVDSFNRYVQAFNTEHREAIARGDKTPLAESSSAFIVKASGIHSRFVMDKDGILDPAIMRPQLPKRRDDEMSFQAEMGLRAAEDALKNAQLAGSDIDLIIVANSNSQRPYPAIAIEIQAALGAKGFAYDMNVACASAVFAVQSASDAISAKTAKRALVISSELCSAHLNFRERDSHFIFGDAATCMVIEDENLVRNPHVGFNVISTKLYTELSNNIRNNFGFLNRCEIGDDPHSSDKLFTQQGRKVFKEVCPAVSSHIVEHLESHQIKASDIKRLWLHQANRTMNNLISRRVLGRDAEPHEAPIILDTYANTSSAGSIIALHLHQNGLQTGDIGVLSAFGAGYSIGSALLKKR